MEAAMSYADTGHLCLTTLHAVNANQALDRIINFFPTDARNQILMDLSLNLAGIISQRLIPATDGGRIPAVEILLNTPYISELVRKGEFGEIKEIMEKGAAVGMQTFDQSLHELFKSEKITMDNALSFADSRSNLEWQINFGGGVKSVSEHDSHVDLMLSADNFGSDDESANPIALSTPLPDLSELNLDGQGQEELRSFSDVSLDIDLNQDAIEDDEDDDFFDSVKSMFSDDQPSKKL